MPTHGSLTKAGKVRSQTPKVTRKPRRSNVPRVRNNLVYRKRILLERKPGQKWQAR